MGFVVILRGKACRDDMHPERGAHRNGHRALTHARHEATIQCHVRFRDQSLTR
jgi:hypothetical protein